MKSTLRLHLFLCAALVFASPAPVLADVVAIIKVTTTKDVGGDPGNCSLREAFANVNAGGQVGTNNCGPAVDTQDDETTQINLPAACVELDDPVWHSANYAAVLGGCIDGGGRTQLFRVAGSDGTFLFLSHTTLKNGYSSGSGGSIAVDSGANLALSATVLKDSYAEQNGGLIDFQGGGFLYVEYSALFGGIAEDWGGALHFAGEDATIQNSSINGNVTYGKGGGIYQTHGAMTLYESRVENNSTQDTPNLDGDGGGIHTSGFLVLRRVSLVGNRSEQGYGGGLFTAPGSDVKVVESRIAHNVAGKLANIGSGGGFYISSDFSLRDSSLSFNNARTLGGALLIAEASSGSKISVENSSFVGNSAKEQGGAVWVHGNSLVNPEDPASPLEKAYALRFLNNTFVNNDSEAQIHLESEDGVVADQQILFVNNVVHSETVAPCSGYWKRLIVKRPNDATPAIYGAQYPVSTCSPALPLVGNLLGPIGAGGYFGQEYAYTQSPVPADPVICAVVEQKDQFGSVRECRLGSVEKSVPVKPVNVFSP